jgi:drug/metabolite transporter (DMT)-like permease
MIAATLLFTVFLWGGNNAGTKFLVKSWPPIFVGCSRFLIAGLILTGLLRWTNWFDRSQAPSEKLKRDLWWRGGLVLASYVVAFNWALRFTSVAHVTLYLGTAPIWALLLEHRPELNWKSAQRYSAAALGLAGVLVLLWSSLRNAESHGIIGQVFSLAASLLWTQYGRQCRTFGASLSGPEVSAHTFWRAGLILTPFAVFEVGTAGLVWNARLATVQTFCILFGGVVAFALWNSALRHWQTSKVYLFINLIPLSSMVWANLCIGEPITPTFGFAMVLIVAGVVLGQTNWQKVFRWQFE